ncbi:glycine oxidase [Cognatiyoonia koreensis]|uniref:Glycine oxidase n=1 Tax=Cognatiyoonia koreensis TaxID=364200 RepID=A0A1I0RCZ7_9RHOB|nr:FAD-dependent oxidoreductase [Cognatiyoonia koreensis]SEW38671.1 glycine oxidase [Cognatiyoonia koreensis]
MATADVTVIGAGIFGLSIAYACVLRGAKVRVIDPGGVAAGASGGIVGALAPHVPEQWNAKKAFQFESLLQAYSFWADVEETTGMQTGYVRSGRIQPLADDAAVALARQRAETAQALWQGKAIWEVISAPKVSWSPQSRTGLVIRDTLSALIHPRKATSALAAAVIAKGGDIATTDRCEGRIVWATGWQGLVEINAGHPRLIGNGVKGQAALFDFDASGEAQLYADGLHIVPHLDGTVAVGSTSERDFGEADSTDYLLDDVISRARTAFPVLENAPVISRWAGVRPRSRSRAPMLGQHPFRPGEFVANGGFKIGFGMAPKVGDVMADLVLDGRVTYPEAFDVTASL